MCCARSDDFNWVVPDYAGHIVVRAGQVGVTDPCFAGRVSGHVCRGSYCADALAGGC